MTLHETVEWLNQGISYLTIHDPIALTRLEMDNDCELVPISPVTIQELDIEDTFYANEQPGPLLIARSTPYLDNGVLAIDIERVSLEDLGIELP